MKLSNQRLKDLFEDGVIDINEYIDEHQCSVKKAVTDWLNEMYTPECLRLKIMEHFNLAT